MHTCRMYMLDSGHLRLLYIHTSVTRLLNCVCRAVTEQVTVHFAGRTMGGQAVMFHSDERTNQCAQPHHLLTASMLVGDGNICYHDLTPEPNGIEDPVVQAYNCTFVRSRPTYCNCLNRLYMILRRNETSKSNLQPAICLAVRIFVTTSLVPRQGGHLSGSDLPQSSEPGKP